MKKSALIILIFIFTFVTCFEINKILTDINVSSTSEYTVKNTIVIDAGHGGADAGTIGIDGTQEKGINLNIALKLYDYLMVSGIDSVLIRDGDYEVYNDNEDRSRSDLYNRMDFINSIDNSILVSIHQNHFENEAEWGTQIWYSANNDESKTLADSILENVKLYLQPDNQRLNKESDNSYYLLYKAQVPSVMVECGFMSNKEENDKLKDTDYQCDMAYSIMLGINEEV
jgi:N-acetylmuramoyl-L-alanine amidase